MIGIEVGNLHATAVVFEVVEIIISVDGLEFGTIVDSILNLFIPVFKLLHDRILPQLQQIVDGEIDLTEVGWCNHIVVTAFSDSFEPRYKGVGKTAVVYDAEKCVVGFIV